jgi:hypothetical protein
MNYKISHINCFFLVVILLKKQTITMAILIFFASSQLKVIQFLNTSFHSLFGITAFFYDIAT